MGTSPICSIMDLGFFFTDEGLRVLLLEYGVEVYSYGGQKIEVCFFNRLGTFRKVFEVKYRCS